MCLLTGLTLTGCGGGESEGSDSSAADVASQIKSEVSDATETVEITEDNDPNDMIGRPNGYEAATALKDGRVDDCGDDLGVDCGATVEEWDDAEAAQDRSDYIQGLPEDSPLLGSEYHYVVENVLVRVTGDLTPSEAEEYEAAVS